MNIIDAIILMSVFVIGSMTYRMGLRDGYSVKMDKPIAQSIKFDMPQIRAFKEDVKKDKEEDKVIQGFMNIMNYDGSQQFGGDK